MTNPPTKPRLRRSIGGPLAVALSGENFEWVAGYVHARFGVLVPASRIGEWWAAAMLKFHGRLGIFGWSDGTFAMWLKNRLSDAGLLPGSGVAKPIWLGVELHVGFLSVEETPEQLAILRRGETIQTGSPSSPGIKRRGTIGPIDRVAARVTKGV